MIFAWLLAMLYPAKCVFCCRLLSKEETDICASCRRRLPYLEGSLRRLPYSSGTVAVLAYEGTVREAILRFKFRRVPQYSAAFGRLLAMKLAGQSLEYDMICHVPVSRRRYRQRGYDQAARLAKATAQELGVPIYSLLQKIRHTPAQSGIHGPERRRANVLGVYRVAHPELVRGRKILVIDDVITTGATLSECCRTLLDAGAAQVSCAALALVRREKKQQVRK